ncbi:MAG: hypothetical protein L6R37_006748 [Teloschistes peruensis]|nr:MAG: hypothetical protein L6R37_006748 [Teloschistes peruensis]
MSTAVASVAPAPLAQRVVTVVFDIRMLRNLDFDQLHGHRTDHAAIPEAVQQMLDERLLSQEKMESLRNHLRVGFKAYQDLRKTREGQRIARGDLPNPEDLKKFRTILRNELLSMHIVTIVFKIQNFRNLEFSYYAECLIKQCQSDLLARRYRADYATIPQTVQSMLNEVLRSQVKIMGLLQRDLRDGFRAYQDLRKRRERSSQGISSQYLVRCFQACPKLSMVEVQTAWKPHDQPTNNTVESLFPVYRSSGKISRSWYLLWLRPVFPRASEELHPLLLEIFSALTLANKPLSHLGIGRCYLMSKISTFDRRIANDVMQHDIFRNLTNLHFDISVVEPLSIFCRPCYFKKTLMTATNLEHLRFGATNEAQNCSNYTMRYNFHPFLESCIFPKLQSLSLEGLVAKVDNFLEFIQNQKELKSLQLKAIDLIPDNELTGEWWCFLKDLRRCSLTRENFQFTIGWPVKLRRNVRNPDMLGCPNEHGEEWEQLKSAIERYVLRDREVNPFKQKPQM